LLFLLQTVVGHSCSLAVHDTSSTVSTLHAFTQTPQLKIATIEAGEENDCGTVDQLTHSEEFACRSTVEKFNCDAGTQTCEAVSLVKYHLKNISQFVLTQNLNLN